ncbi:bifunctional phosphopantothenoylcysteine decarboxylase/phosphopantothenate--cysteine ligase CoaBC [Prosthecochloris sp. HL-130-GSB]|jgi:phosphopantothenoylcysteine decarboxylase / phosphopantothenate---cysteine ligase|uniref:bifunctional phosphopantothenoylcysteine decarboxylase/phosphopantothenate--cysteine ligase CoaBC n=1 Tax=Prosthecochloris sp. HL-130-GSB TaxID=1974213 RepID=UPI000A1C196C|nr:bifunctional phosphopantothenoylcysteine decarboxylase/phosphopantothenate--cysteine ligase CoaBC [Prosthecochloris sp. HL-130-GSB]ARM30249.1 phosphopantothenoylcysteine decarboxylase [Prosthecochloris sp. HL-130-GSB]MBO8091858.1 bifunctional phosphopantothenoylcysteine decarboxylase/phosphopantothenate--cysteine ligase CoaBC [Prosthecochloris sp.]
MNLEGKHILLGISGGIAAYKIPMVIRLLKKQGAQVRVVLTRAASQFVTELTLSTVSQEPVLREIFPESHASQQDWTRHISLGDWADALVIAPATAHTLAKLTAGLCDDLLSTCFITLPADKPRLIFPAMDGHMYRSPSVQRNIGWLMEQGCIVIEPESGALASGQCGTGRMPEPETIADAVARAIGDHHSPATGSFAGRNIIVTAGPTRENIDGVRFISNHSSGKMGFAIACAAARRGADVTLITGPVALETPADVRRIDVTTACEMDQAVKDISGACDIFIGAAAVADYRPAEPVDGKIRKTAETMQLSLVRNPDILAGFASRKQPGQLAIGFALETEGNLDAAREKLQAKRLDLIAFNTYDGMTTGFDVDTNILTLISKNGETTTLPLLSKQEAARRLLDNIQALLPAPHPTATND